MYIEIQTIETNQNVTLHCINSDLFDIYLQVKKNEVEIGSRRDLAGRLCLIDFHTGKIDIHFEKLKLN